MTATHNNWRRSIGTFIVLCALSSSVGAQSADPVQLTVPSLNMPADQQLALAKAIYQQLLSQGASISSLVIVDSAGVQVSFDATTLAAP